MKYLPFLLYLICSFASAADPATDQFVRTLNEVNRYFEKDRGQGAMTCPPEKITNPTCSLNPLCQEVRKNADRTELYTSPTGSIPNFVWKEAIDTNVTACLNQKRDLLLSQSEAALESSLAAADGATRDAYARFLDGEYKSLVSGEKSSLQRLGANPSPGAVAGLLGQIAPEIRDPQVVANLSQVMALKDTTARQNKWQALITRTLPSVNVEAVRANVENVRTSMRQWLASNGKDFAGPGTASLIDKTEIVIITDPASPDCRPNDVASYHRGLNRMTVCPRGTTLPAAGLFTVVAHEFGHTVGTCQVEIGSTPEKETAWSRVDQCLENPLTGPAHRKVSWQEILGRIDLQTTTLNAPRVQELLRYKETPYACLGGIAEAFGAVNVNIPADQTEETHADWISSQLIEQHVKNLTPVQARNFAFEALTPSILRRACDLTQSAILPRIQAVLREAGCDSVKVLSPTALKDVGGDEHMAPDVRFKVYLAVPAIHQAYGCPGAGGGCR